METEELERYTSCFLELLKYTRELVWRIFSAFVLPQTILLAFLLSVGFGEQRFIGWSPGIFIAAIVGLVLCVGWLGSCLRYLAYYRFSIAQAREIEPLNWDLYKGKRREFADGCAVKIEGRYYQTKWFEKFRVKCAILTIVAAFFITYLTIIVLRGPWVK